MKRQIVSGLVAAGLMLSIKPMLGLLHAPDGEIKTRAINIMLGLMVVWIANSTPKQITPLSALTCSPDQEQRLRRASGMLIVLGGVIYSLAWLAAPFDLAFPLSMTALGGAVLVTLTLCLRAAQQRRA